MATKKNVKAASKTAKVAKKATKVFNKSMNQLSQEEVLELVDKHMEEIFFNAEENSPESTQKIFKEIISKIPALYLWLLSRP